MTAGHERFRMRVQLGPSLDRRARTVAVAAVDLGVIALVIGYGVTSHGGDPLAEPGYVLRVILPFWVGWAVVAPVAGAYGPEAARRYPAGIASTIVGWILGVLLASLARTSPWLPGDAPPIFLLAVSVAGLVGLLPWRLGRVLFERKL